MKKPCIAAIMDRHYIGDELFVFNCNLAIEGTIDEETKIFTDIYGNKFLPIVDPSLLKSELPRGYINEIATEELLKKFKSHLTLSEAIAEFEKIMKNNVFFVGLIGGQNPFYMQIDINDVRNAAKTQYEVDEKQSNQSEEQVKDEDCNECNKNSQIENLIIDIINGKYSKKELKKIRATTQSEFDMLESLLDTINLHLADKEQEEIPIPQHTKNKMQKSSANASETSQKKEVLKIITPFNIDELFKMVTKTLIAQDDPARRVIVEIARKEMDERKKKEGILLTGDTGVGKTELMRLIAKYLEKPFYKVDSTQLTIPGYIGKDIEEVLWDLYVSCGKNIKEAEQAIIFFDEIDKKGSSKKEDASGKGVLNLLLSFIEGTTYDATESTKSGSSSPKIKINTSNMTVILGGAFTDVYKNLLEKNNIGFNETVTSKKIRREPTIDDFVEKSMMTDEFMGRVNVVRLNELDADAIKRVLLESDQSALRVQEDIFKKMGVKITFTDGYITEIAKGAERKKTGARGLNTMVDNTTWRAFDEVCCHLGDYEEVILDESTVEDPASFQLIKRRENN